MFAVPITVYDVYWKRPNGRPIQHRENGDPVQGELAFDPFALMDEQPDSALTTLTLKPTRTVESRFFEDEDGEKKRRWSPKMFTRKLKGPQTLQDLELHETEYVGCC